MARSPAGADERTRLHRVQARVRELARTHDWLARAMRGSFEGYLALLARFASATAALGDRELRMARELLANGRLFDPTCTGSRPCLFVGIEGLCPVEIAADLGRQGPGSAMPTDLERAGAAAALAALDRDAIYQARDLPRDRREAMAAQYRASIDAGTHVEFAWLIVVARPEDWETPPDPRNLDCADLSRFAEPDYRTIVLYRLGGLADTGALRPIVPKPAPTGNIMEDMAAEVAWRARFPIEDGANEQTRSVLSVADFPPDVAEQMLKDIERWMNSAIASHPPEPGSGRDGPYGEPTKYGDLSQKAEPRAERGGDAQGEESTAPALTVSQVLVLRTMARFDPSIRVSAKMIEDEMDLSIRLSSRTIGPIVKKLIEDGLAERSDGPRKGARLTMRGRRLASRLAD